MNFTHLFLFVFALFSLISAIIEFRLMPNETNRNWKKVISILTMVMALLVLLFTLYNLTMATQTGAALASRLQGKTPLEQVTAAAASMSQSQT
jgi:hypothetical protein